MDTLLLDKGYSAIARITWRKAITLVYSSKAEIIENYIDREIRTVSRSFKMPCVVRLLSSQSFSYHRNTVRLSKVAVYRRDEGRCQYCNRRVTRAEATLDHVKPKVQGGTTVWQNVVTCCSACNNRKGGRTPEQANMGLLKSPARPKYAEYLTMLLADDQKIPSSWKMYVRAVKDVALTTKHRTQCL